MENRASSRLKANAASFGNGAGRSSVFRLQGAIDIECSASCNKLGGREGISDYREDVGRSVSEAGLTEHLVLLSIYQTCRVRDISFLKFLLSRERDIDAFAAGKRRRQRAPRIELYPKGYLPPSIGSLRRAQATRASDTIAAEAE